MKGFCVKCRMNRDLEKVQEVKMANGKPAITAECGECGTAVYALPAGSDLRGTGISSKKGKGEGKKAGAKATAKAKGKGKAKGKAKAKSGRRARPRTTAKRETTQVETLA